MNLLTPAIFAYSVLVTATYTFQRALMYPAPKRGIVPSLEGATLQSFPGGDDRTVYALHRPAVGDGPTVVHFHGNGEELDHTRHLVWELGRRGVGCFSVEYPGYGLARDYKTTEANIYRDAEAALRYLEQDLGAKNIVLVGQSLGTGIAVEMAARGHGRRLVLISPFTSMTAMARRVMPIVPTGWLLKDRYDSDRKLEGLTQPSLVIHGTTDAVIPLPMGRKVHSKLKSSTMIEVTGAGHNDLWERDRSLYDRIADFAKQR